MSFAALWYYIPDAICDWKMQNVTHSFELPALIGIHKRLVL